MEPNFWKELHWCDVQVHPVVSRLCAPIEGTDAARLADCLGLDTAKYHSAPSGESLRDALDEAQLASTASLDSDARYKVRRRGICSDCTRARRWFLTNVGAA
jgi:hypothetical protein